MGHGSRVKWQSIVIYGLFKFESENVYSVYLTLVNVTLVRYQYVSADFCVITRWRHSRKHCVVTGRRLHSFECGLLSRIY